MATTEGGRMMNKVINRREPRTIPYYSASQQVLRPSPDLRGLRPMWPGRPAGQVCACRDMLNSRPGPCPGFVSSSCQGADCHSLASLP